jgi:hypothetical protein
LRAAAPSQLGALGALPPPSPPHWRTRTHSLTLRTTQQRLPLSHPPPTQNNNNKPRPPPHTTAAAKSLGPALPAFLTPEALQVLVDKFGIQPANIADPTADLLAMMANK